MPTVDHVIVAGALSDEGRLILIRVVSPYMMRLDWAWSEAEKQYILATLVIIHTTFW
jgi:hypothetical protein